MKKPKSGAGSAQPQPLAFPIAQVHVADLIGRMGDEEILTLLDDHVGEAREAYFRSWTEFRQQQNAVPNYRTNDRERAFRGALDYQHPLYRGHWATADRGGDYVQTQLERALKAKDWQEVMMLAGMLCVREMLYGRAVQAKAAPAPKAKAVKKTAKKKPATKKPASTFKRTAPKALPHRHPAQRPGYRQPTRQQLRRARQTLGKQGRAVR